MKAYLIDVNGTEHELPELLSWDVCHGLGEPCDYFEVSTLYTPELLQYLTAAVRFRAEHSGETVFYGVVDEYLVTIDGRGSSVSVNGRSLAALLMDNEVTKCTYYMMTKSSVRQNYLIPFGITEVASGTMNDVLMFPVKSGDSAWSVLRRFCLKSARAIPGFTPSGQLRMTGLSGTTVTVNADSGAERVRYKDERYGIISEICVTNRATGGSYTLTNEDFCDRGGSRKRYVFTDKFDSVLSPGSDAGGHETGEDYIADSQRGKNCIELTVPTLFPCFPGDRVQLTSTALGVSGTYKVSSTHCWADSSGGGTVITLEVS